MKRVRYIFLLILLLAMISCGGEEPENPKNKSENKENNSGNNGNNNSGNNETIISYYFNTCEIELNRDGGSRDIECGSNTEWEITSVTGNVTGLSVSGPTKGTGNVRLNISYSAVPNRYDYYETAQINFKVKMGTSKQWRYENKSYLLWRRGKTTPP